MQKEQQTDEVKRKLYDLTLSFVRKHQPHYYKQYKGEAEDLALDFFCEFLTPKARVKGKEASLLDKYDPELCPEGMSQDTFFANLVKVCVLRMLIDRSRSDKIIVRSIDQFVDEFGDALTKAFNLTTEQHDIDGLSFARDYVELVKLKFSHLNMRTQKILIEQYSEIKNVIDPRYKALFDQVIPEPEQPEQKLTEYFVQIERGTSSEIVMCQQITPKTVCALVDGVVLDFDRVSGICRKKDIAVVLTPQTLEEVSKMQIFKSKYSRHEMERKFTVG